MSSVSSWVLSIVGVVIITVLVEIIMPEGNINKYIKGFLVIFTIFIMVEPITNISIEDIFSEGDYYLTLDNEFLEEINEDKAREYELVIESKLNTSGYKNVDINIETKSENGTLKITTIFVDLCKLVLNENLENINIYNNIKGIIKSVVTIDAEDIIFNE